MLSAVAAVATVLVSMQSQPLLLPPPLLPLFPRTSPLPPKQYFEHHPGERTIAIVADVDPGAAAATTTTAISSTIAAPFWLTVVSFSPFATAALVVAEIW